MWNITHCQPVYQERNNMYVNNLSNKHKKIDIQINHSFQTILKNLQENFMSTFIACLAKHICAKKR